MASPAARDSRRPPLLPPELPAPLASVPPLARGWIATPLADGHTLFRNPTINAWQWDVPQCNGDAVAAADVEGDNELSVLWPSERCALCSGDGEPGGCISCGTTPQVRWGGGLRAPPPPPPPQLRSQGASTCECIGVHISMGGASCTPRRGVYIPPGGTACERHTQLRSARSQVLPLLSPFGVQRGWADPKHMHIATQTDEIGQFAPDALADLPFRRFGPAVCDIDKYWEYVLSRSSQTWADQESFARFERFLQRPAYSATFLSGADGSFEDDDNLIPASVVLADESPCRWQATSESPFDPFFSPCDLIIGAYVPPQPPVTQKPRKRLRQGQPKKNHFGAILHILDARGHNSTKAT